MHFTEGLVDEVFLVGHHLPVAVDRMGGAAGAGHAPEPLPVFRHHRRLVLPGTLREADAQRLLRFVS